MEKNIEKSFIQIGLYFQIAYTVFIAISLSGLIMCAVVIFRYIYLLSNGKADYLVWILVISILLTIFIIILSIIPIIVLSFILTKESTSKGVILIVLAIIAALLCNFVSAILWFASAISLLGRKKSVFATDTITIQNNKETSNQASHKDTCKTELDSQVEPPEFKNIATKNVEGSNQETLTDEVESENDSDYAGPPIESKNHSSKKD
ncbi:hypothetical protein [Staphylococcus schweitzeri]|uniref:MFS transporter n=1 Tax=Staphylococcus schweitzeri TaxID=1654388 RepID=A0ABR9N7E9_9STAP|nr:hypothetical protein [Staphylococcus schweitzeri]MBE2127975.1 MFS transporter [Staphylococcus schweitzeri]CDR52987.1 hypothetical protein ERS140266_00280 [Staphylococcus schweitzeri]VEE64708.1 Uncharacterised protein [Staphylococcus schweitzeri]